MVDAVVSKVEKEPALERDCRQSVRVSGGDNSYEENKKTI